MNFLVTNEVNQPRAAINARQPPTQSSQLRCPPHPPTRRPKDRLLRSPSNHAPPHPRPDPSHQRRVVILNAPSSPGRVQTPHATWLIALNATFTARCQPALTRRLRWTQRHRLTRPPLDLSARGRNPQRPLVTRSRANNARHLALPLPQRHQPLMKTGPADAAPEGALFPTPDTRRPHPPPPPQRAPLRRPCLLPHPRRNRRPPPAKRAPLGALPFSSHDRRRGPDPRRTAARPFPPAPHFTCGASSPLA